MRTDVTGCRVAKISAGALLVANLIAGGGQGASPFSLFPLSSFSFFYHLIDTRGYYTIVATVDGKKYDVFRQSLLHRNDVASRQTFRYVILKYVEAVRIRNIAEADVLLNRINGQLLPIVSDFEIVRVNSRPDDEYLNGSAVATLFERHVRQSI